MLKPVYDYLDWNAPNAYAKGWTKPVLVPPPLDPQARVVPEPPGADMEINFGGNRATGDHYRRGVTGQSPVWGVAEDPLRGAVARGACPPPLKSIFVVGGTAPLTPILPVA